MNMRDCCFKGFRWDGPLRGKEGKLAGRDCYITTGTFDSSTANADAAIIILHDMYGWTFPNTRLLADHYAEEVGATVYVPDL